MEIVEPGFRATDYLWMGERGLLAFLGQFAIILFLVYFFLVTDDLYKRKLVKIAGPTLTKKKVTVQILDEINRQIENFISVQVLTSLLVAVATAALLWWFGVKQFVDLGIARRDLQLDSLPRSDHRHSGLGVVAFMQFDDLLARATSPRRRDGDHQPRRLPAHAGADGPRGADESRWRSSSACSSGAGSGASGARSWPCRC